MKYVLWTAAALLITGAAVAVTHSDEMGPWHRHHGPGGFPLAMLAHHLDLTDAQKTALTLLTAKTSDGYSGVINLDVAVA